jgi:phenylalanyl-tRNA synthetase alpha chain
VIDRLKQIKLLTEKRIAEVSDFDSLNEIKVKILGRKGEMTLLLRGLKDLVGEERAEAGKAANDIKNILEKMIDDKTAELKRMELELKLKREEIDVTLPGLPQAGGGKHPISRVADEIKAIFIGMGFDVAEGPQIETDYYNFEALNVPKDHPAREMQDTFYITEEMLLRTHTSPVQVRTMEKRQPPVRIIAPGKVYRVDADTTHSPMFHQVEGLLVDRNVTLGDLKGTLAMFARELFGKDRGVRFRPSYFPFTEPSAEMDISCFVCGGEGCRLCKYEGWIEILGAGMVHPRVFEMVNYDSEQVTGFAFGMGVERVAMLRYGIDDIRLLFESDVRFLSQF